MSHISVIVTGSEFDQGMTRRQRPTQSSAPRHENVAQSKAQAAKRARPKAVDFLSESDSEDAELVQSTVACPRQAREKNSESDDRDTNTDSPDTDDEDIDAPRVAQWIDDEQLELQTHSDNDTFGSDSEGHDDDDHSPNRGGPLHRLRSLEDDLSMLPLGTLRSAQRSLALAHALSDETDSDSAPEDGVCASEEEDVSFPRPFKGKGKEKPGQTSKSQNGLVKRANKHAPMEVTSKRPVSRRRNVVDDKFPKPRDPRFMHSAGRYDDPQFNQRYNFLSGLRKDELTTLREHVRRARKLLANSPLHMRAEREEEVNRLERAMKRAESAVNIDNREHVEREALQTAKKTETEKRKKGKAGWWMKRSEKKELLAKARLNAIAAVGGKQAVKKAVEKKQKKISQKEKRMRPFPRSEGAELSNGKKRRPVKSVDSGGAKRRKVG